MSAKSAIQNLQDSELIRIFLEFVQTYHLQYQKIDKEISYKCHEATWILASTKATGYGRTESEAYKHALRNLLQILIEDPPYTQFFVSMLSAGLEKTGHSNPTNSTQTRISQNLNSKQKPIFSSSVNKPPLFSHLSASLTSNPSTTLANQRQLKTEEKDVQDEYPEKEANRLNTSTNMKYQAMCKGNPSTYVGSYKCLIPDQGYGEYRKQYNKNQVNAGQLYENEQTDAEKGFLDRSNTNAKTSSYGAGEELKQALARNRSLIDELASISRENQMLRAQVQNLGKVYKNKGTPVDENQGSSGLITIGSNNGLTDNSLSTNVNPNGNGGVNSKGMRLSMGSNHNSSSSYLQPSHIKAYSHANINLGSNSTHATNNPNGPTQMGSANQNGSSGSNYSNSLYTTNSAMRDISNNIKEPTATINMKEVGNIKDMGNNSQKAEDGRSNQVGRVSNNKSKVMVPKLKLEILPNYHKKAEKSLNDSLLAVYQQKHGVTNTSNCGESVGFMNVSVHNIKKII